MNYWLPNGSGVLMDRVCAMHAKMHNNICTQYYKFTIVQSQLLRFNDYIIIHIFIGLIKQVKKAVQISMDKTQAQGMNNTNIM